MKRVAHGAFWTLSGSIASRGLTMLAMIFVARLLGAPDFGRFGVIRSTTDLFAILLGFGISVTASKHVAEFRSNDPEKAGRIITLAVIMATVLGGLLTALFWAISPFLATEYLKDPSLVLPLKISSSYLLLNAWTGVFAGAMDGFEAFKRSAFAHACVGIGGAAAIVACSYLFGVKGTVAGYGLYYAMSAASLGYFMLVEMRRAGVPLTFKAVWGEAPLIYRFSLPAIIVGAIGGPVNWMAYAYTSRLPDGFRMVGIFSAARIIQLIVTQVGVALHGPLLAISANVGKKDDGSIGRLNVLATWMLGTLGIIIPICLPELVGLVFGGKYQSTEFNKIVTLTCLTSYCMMYKQGFNRVVTVQNFLWWGVADNLFWGLLLLGLVPALAVKYGALGFAMAFTLAYVVNFVGIAPLYLRLGIMSREFVGSIRSLAISGLVLGPVFMVMAEVPVVWRAIYLAPAIAGILWNFYRLWIARPAIGSSPDPGCPTTALPSASVQT